MCADLHYIARREDPSLYINEYASALEIAYDTHIANIRQFLREHSVVVARTYDDDYDGYAAMFAEDRRTYERGRRDRERDRETRIVTPPASPKPSPDIIGTGECSICLDIDELCEITHADGTVPHKDADHRVCMRCLARLKACPFCRAQL